MQTIFRLAAALIPVVTVTLASGFATRDAAETLLVEQAVKHYVKGMAAADTAALQQVFHPTAQLHTVKDGRISAIDASTWYAKVAETGADASKRQASLGAERRVREVHVTGTAAMARVETRYGAKRVTDYLSLVREGAQWWIVERVTHVELPPSAEAGRGVAAR